MGLFSRFWLLAFSLVVFSSYSLAYNEPCQLVAQMAGNKEYKQQPYRMASMVSADEMPKALNLSHLETHGAWHVYQAQQPWMTKEQCAPVREFHGGLAYDFVPVVLNKATGHNAVITGTFIIKVYRRNHVNRVLQRYGFKVLSPLPNPESFIVDVRPRNSYDQLIRDLDKDKDVRFALPVLSEPRARR